MDLWVYKSNHPLKVNVSNCTLNQEFGGARDPSTTVGSYHGVRPRILWEGLSDQQGIQVSFLQEPEVRGALDLCSLPVEFHPRGGDPAHSDAQLHLAALSHCGALQSLKEAGWDGLRWGDKHNFSQRILQLNV